MVARLREQRRQLKRRKQEGPVLERVRKRQVLPTPHDLAQTLPKHVDDGVHIARARSRVATKPNTALFWSGRSVAAAGNKVGGAERAAEIARENKGLHSRR